MPNRQPQLKKIGYLQKLLLKLTDRSAYYEMKNRAKREERYRQNISFYNPGPQIPHAVSTRSTVFKHSGNAGDIIYSLPCIRELGGSMGSELHLKLDVPMRAKHLPHPLGGVQLNMQMFEKLYPLLSVQPYIKKLEILGRDTQVDFDLDTFRDTPMPLDKLAISRWYFFMTGAAADLSKPWLSAPRDSRFKDCIVVARSFRYRNPAIDHSLLNKYRNIVFIGLEDEYEDMRASVSDLKYQPVNDFLEMAGIIGSCRLFIGNQSFPFSIAEALKTPRLLEIDPETPNVHPVGECAHEILFQNQYEHVLSKILETNLLH